jgi:hypothetical protein
MAPNKPYEFIGFGDIHGPKPYEFTGFGDIHGPKPYEFLGGSKLHPPTEKPLEKVGGEAPPPFSIGFPVGGDRIDPHSRRFQDRFFRNAQIRTSGLKEAVF